MVRTKLPDIHENGYGAARDLAFEDFCSDIIRMPGENLGLAFPAFCVDGRTRGRQAINCAAFAADHEIFSQLLLPSAFTPVCAENLNPHIMVMKSA